MAAIITVILILVFSILITRVAAIALTHTGLSRESSKFQARSAFTGVGFTTSESEKVDTWIKVLILVGGALILWNLANSQWVDQQLSRIIEKYLKKYGGLSVTDYASLLQLSGDYKIAEIAIECDHWLCNKKMSASKT